MIIQVYVMTTIFIIMEFFSNTLGDGSKYPRALAAVAAESKFFIRAAVNSKCFAVEFVQKVNSFKLQIIKSLFLTIINVNQESFMQSINLF